MCLAFSLASVWDPVMTMIEGEKKIPLCIPPLKKKEKEKEGAYLLTMIVFCSDVINGSVE